MTRTDARGTIDLFVDLVRRSPLLEELRREPLDRAEIRDRLDVSRSTSHRHTRLLAELDVVERRHGRFALTESGRLLADAMVRFKSDVGTALRLAPVLEAVGDAPVELDADALVGATVTSTDDGDPFSPVVRFVSLARETETLRGLDIDAIAPLYMEEITRHIVEGMETVDVSLPEVTRNALDDYPERCVDACASGNLTVRLHDDLPFALAVFDDRVGIGVYERDTRNLRTFVDTDAPAVREWALTVYESYADEAVRMEEFTPRGFREAMARHSTG